MGKATLSVVIPATNRPSSLDECLAGVRDALGPDDELIVVDHGTSGSPARIRNSGARRARGDVLVFIDADVVPHRDALERFRAAFDEDPTLVAAFGSYDACPPGGLASRFRNLLHHHVHHESAGEAQTFWAGLGAVRRGQFLAVGGFDAPRYPRPMLEDVELGLRLTDTGHRILLMPEVEGRHLKSWSLREMLWADFRNRGIPWTRLLIDRREAPATLNLGWHHRITALSIALAPVLTAVTLQPAFLLAALVLIIALNRRFYGVLRREGGAVLAVAGVGLHVLHHLAAMLAVPPGIVAYFRHRGRLAVPQPITAVEAPEGAGTPNRGADVPLARA